LKYQQDSVILEDYKSAVKYTCPFYYSCKIR